MASGSSRVIYAALIGNGIIMVIKFLVAILTRSSAMMAEAVHSMADMGNQGLLLLGIRLSRRPADQEHAFGHGKEQYFWSFLVANLLFALGALFSIYEGLNKLLHPHALERVYLIYLILGAAIIIEGYSFSLALREFFRQKQGAAFWGALKESKDPNLIVVLVEDAAALAGLVIAFFGTLLADTTGLMLFDGVASIVIGLILAAVALFLANEMRQLLLGEGTSEGNLQRIREVVAAFPEVTRPGRMYSMHLGPDQILLAMHVDFKDEITAGELERLIPLIKDRIRRELPEVRQIFLEAEQGAD